jgi:hypothetical protein
LSVKLGGIQTLDLKRSILSDILEVMSLPRLKIHVSISWYFDKRNYERREYFPVGPIDRAVLKQGVAVVFLV